MLVIASLLLLRGDVSKSGLLASTAVGVVLGWRLVARGKNGQLAITRRSRGDHRGRLPKPLAPAGSLLIAIVELTLVARFGLPPPLLSYFVVVTAGIFGLMLLPALDAPGCRWIAVASVALNSILVRGLGWFAYPPGYVGVDAWYHAALVSQTNATGFIPASTDYGWFPLMQIGTSALSQLTGLDVRSAMFVFVTIPVTVLVPTAVYGLLTKHGGGFLGSVVGAMLFAFLPDLVYWGYSPIPMSMSLGFLFLALLIASEVQQRTAKIALLAVVFLSSLLTHSIGSLVLALFLGFVPIFQSLLSRLGLGETNQGYTAAFGATLVIAIVGYWSEASGFLFPFVVRAFAFGLRLDAFSPPLATGSDSVTILATTASTGSVLALAACGTTVGLRSGPPLNKMLSLFGFAWLVVGVTLVSQTGGLFAILPARWGLFGLALLIVPAGAGFRSLFATGNSNQRGRWIAIGLVALFLAGSTLHPSLGPVPRSPELYPRLGLTEGEYVAATWVLNHRFSEAVYSDPLMNLRLASLPGIPVRDGTPVLTSGADWSGLFVFRQEAANQSIYVLAPGKVFWQAIALNQSRIDSIVNGPNSIVYDDGSTLVVRS